MARLVASTQSGCMPHGPRPLTTPPTHARCSEHAWRSPACQAAAGTRCAAELHTEALHSLSAPCTACQTRPGRDRVDPGARKPRHSRRTLPRPASQCAKGACGAAAPRAPHPPTASTLPAASPRQSACAWCMAGAAAPASCPHKPLATALNLLFPRAAAAAAAWQAPQPLTWQAGPPRGWPKVRPASAAAAAPCALERLCERHHRRRRRPDDAWADTGCRRPG